MRTQSTFIISDIFNQLLDKNLFFSDNQLNVQLRITHEYHCY